MDTSLWELDPTPKHYSYFESFPFFRKGNDLHPTYAIYLLEKGSFDYRIGNGKCETLYANELVICPPHTNFSKAVRESVTMHLIYVKIDDGAALPIGKIRYGKDTRINETLSRLKGLVSQKELPTVCYRAHLIKDVWYSVCALLDSPFVAYSAAEPTESPVFSEMTDYIKAHPDTSLADIARAFSCSRMTVNKYFRRYTGETVGRYIQKLRIECACRLLAETSDPYKVIAPLCGFANEYYFATCFREYTGYTPGDYRRFLKKAWQKLSDIKHDFME